MLRFSCLALAIAIVSAGATAHAQPAPKSDPAAAQALFAQARALAAERRYAEACPKFEESLRLDYGIGTEFNLAECNERLGKIATAWSRFLSVAAGAKAKGQAERERVARDRATALEPRLPKLVVEVPAPAPGLEVTRDGVVVGSASWGVAVPVDPGPHRVTASATGMAPWETTVTTTLGKTSRISVPRQTAAPVATLGPPVPPATPPPNPITTTMPPATESSDGSAQRAVGWLLGGVGLAGLGVGAGFGLRSMSQKSDSEPYCNGDVCTSDGVTLREEAVKSGNVATVATIAGAGVFATGLIVLLTAPKSRRSTQSAWAASPTVAGAGGGFSVRGTFQ